MQMLRSAIAELPDDLFRQARALVCAPFAEPPDAYGRVAPTAIRIAIDDDKVIGHSFECERSVVLGNRSIVIGPIADVAVSAERQGEGLCTALPEGAMND